MNGGGRWIPLWFFSANESRTVYDIISLGDITEEMLLTLRGHTVNFTVHESEALNVKICGPKVFDQQAVKGLFNWRFRWLQTVANDYVYMNDEDGDDVIYIYNVSITIVNGTQEDLVGHMLFQDDFSEGKLR